MCDPDVARAANDEAGIQLALDPSFTPKGFEYGRFLGELWHAGVIEEGCDADVREEVGAFLARRKDDRQRVIFDTLRANLHFHPPPHVELASGEAISEISVGRPQRQAAH